MLQLEIPRHQRRNQRHSGRISRDTDREPSPAILLPGLESRELHGLDVGSGSRTGCSDDTTHGCTGATWGAIAGVCELPGSPEETGAGG